MTGHQVHGTSTGISRQHPCLWIAVRAPRCVSEGMAPLLQNTALVRQPLGCSPFPDQQVGMGPNRGQLELLSQTLQASSPIF